MNQKKGLTLNGLNTPNFIFIFMSLSMIAVSIYLTSHFYDVLYPTKLGAASTLCNLSSVLNCDAATYSKISNIAGVPISFFGIMIGVLFLFSSIMPSAAFEKTASAFAAYNFIGCIALFLFSIIALGSLCPLCTLYYVFSGVAFYLFWRFGERSWMPDIKVTLIWFAIVLIGSYFFYSHTNEKANLSSRLNASVVSQFRALQNFGDPDMDSPYRIHSATEKFADAPIRISVFSDFQCPFCKVVSDQMPELVRRYGDKINIQYIFYPLDSKCNSNVKSRFHDNACDAAALAACDPAKFHEVHDEIFAKQAQLGSGALKEIESKYSLQGCIDKKEITDKVVEGINQGTKFNLKSTPTIIINGRKIEGTIPNSQFFAIFEEILGNK